MADSGQHPTTPTGPKSRSGCSCRAGAARLSCGSWPPSSRKVGTSNGKILSSTLWLCQNSYWKWPFSSWIFPLKMVIFHSYVSLPEDTLQVGFPYENDLHTSPRKSRAFGALGEANWLIQESWPFFSRYGVDELSKPIRWNYMTDAPPFAKPTL